MDPDNPVLNTEEIVNTEAITDKKAANPTKAISGTPVARSGPSINTLFTYDKSDGEFAPFASHLAKAYYPGAKLVGIDSVQNLAGVLSKYANINTLVIFTHSIPGSLILNGVVKTSQFVNAELAKSKVLINNRIVFEGCEIMQDPVDTCKMIGSIAGSSVNVIGYSYYTITQIIKFDFTGINDVNTVKQQYQKFDNKYWLPGLPDADRALNKKIEHGRRWFRDMLDSTPPEGQNFRRIESYSSLGRKSAKNLKEAQQIEQEYDSPVFAGDIITVSNVSSIVQATP